MFNQVIEDYHSLLNDQIAADTDGQLRETLKQRGLYFGNRPICTVLRPHFYIRSHWDHIKRETETLLTAFARAHDLCVQNADLRAQLRLQDYEEQLFALDTGTGAAPWSTSRLDSFFNVDNQGLQFVEYNAETPAGMGYEDILAEAFMELEPMKRFAERYQVRHMPLIHELMFTLLRAYKDWGGKHKPQIAIIDWQNVPTLNEHEMIRAHFERSNFRTIMADPRALEYRNGQLWVGNFRIDMIYKRVLWSELIQEMGIENPITAAIRDRAVFMTNSVSCKLMAKKASFAFLSDERNAPLFTSEQRAAIHNHIPWTRVIEERKTVYQGQEVDLLPFITERRDCFVLKPNDEYGGKGVIIGWECTLDEWNDALHHSQTTPYVVQERAEGVQRPFPSYIDGRLDISPRNVDADPYVFYGRTVYGCLTRLSSLTLLNVTAGGGSVVPCFVVEKKS
jgi:glutathionylspermidine synthase